MTRSKFNAVRTTIDNITFASKREAARYAELKMLEKVGEINGLELQPKFPIMVKRRGTNAMQRVGVYIADFRYTRLGYRPLTDQDVIEDVKGVKTPVYRLKKKLVEAQYGITITEVA